MSEEQQSSTSRPPTERAEELLARLGKRFSETRASMGQRLEQSAQQSGRNGEPRPAVERAEQTLDQFGERVGGFAATAAQRLRQLSARAREEIEDMWAEAQSMRQNPPASATPETPKEGDTTGTAAGDEHPT
jgi:DNA anti-recombination protein RmuC